MDLLKIYFFLILKILFIIFKETIFFCIIKEDWKKRIYMIFILEHELNNTIQFLKDKLINSPIQNNINNLQYNDKKEKIIGLIEDEFIQILSKIQII